MPPGLSQRLQAEHKPQSRCPTQEHTQEAVTPPTFPGPDFLGAWPYQHFEWGSSWGSVHPLWGLSTPAPSTGWDEQKHSADAKS